LEAESQRKKQLKLSTFSIHTSCYLTQQSRAIERMIDASEGTVMQHALSSDMLPTTTISLDDLRQENWFLSGYKATKNGKLVYVALFDFLPSDRVLVVNTISLDEETCMNFKVVVRGCSVESRSDEIERRRLHLLNDANMRDRLIESTSVIARRVSDLFRVQSNLVAVEPCWMDGEARIRFLVSCKHYVPDGESELPVELDGVRTCVRQGWFRLTSGICGGY
jgi:hypothetical protein